MSRELELEYCREGTTYTGQLSYAPEGLPGRVVLATFNKTSYRQMLERLSDTLRAHEEVTQVRMLRSDSFTVKPVSLDEPTVHLLRTDFDKIIDSFCPAPVHVTVREKAGAQAGSPATCAHPEIPAGYDTVVDSFGDYVYIRLRKLDTPAESALLVESFVNGRWLRGYEKDEQYIEVPQLECTLERVSNKWARVKTTELLYRGKANAVQDFFLPRAWNKKGSWISYEELRTMFVNYSKEKTDVQL